jgi:TRAP-type C4-dicarboxylate transport system substrate-binding protein
VTRFINPRGLRGTIAAGAAAVFAVNLLIQDAAAQSKMRIAHAYPEHTQHGRNMAFFKQKVEELTGGRLVVTIHPNAELGAISQEVTMVQTGTVDATYNISGIVEGVDPGEAIWNIPFLLKVAPGQGEHMRRVMNDKTIQNILAKRQAGKGLKRLGHIPTLNGFMVVSNNVRAVEKLDDLKGLRIRHPGGLMGELYIRNLGASPMTVAGAEVPVALQQGVVDGLVTTPVHYHDARWHTKFMTLPFYAGYGLPFLASLRWWNSLPKDLQEIIETKAIPETQAYAAKAVDELEIRYIKEMQAAPYNVKISWLSPEEMENFAGKVRDAAVERFVKAVGADGQTMVDQVKKLGEGIEIKR